MEKQELLKNLYSIDCEIENLKKIGLEEDIEEIKQLEKMKKMIEKKLKQLEKED